MPKTQRQKVTVYSKGMLGINQYEVRLVKHGTKKYAQYGNAPFVHFVPKRCRKARGIQGSYSPWILVLDGWGHPKMDVWQPAREEHGCIVQEALYGGCDPRWDTDADTKLDAYIAETGVDVVGDYRHTKGFNPHRKEE